MGKHETGYARVPKDLYPTPEWPTKALLEFINIKNKCIWEPACDTGNMSEVLRAAGATVFSSDIVDRGYRDAVFDFTMAAQFALFPDSLPGGIYASYDGIITDPPYGGRGKLAKAFVENGLARIGNTGFLALLLPADFDSAKTRHHLFGRYPQFVGNVVLVKRIKWFDEPGKNKSPKENSSRFKSIMRGHNTSPSMTSSC